jgi:hypothetical protein
MAVAHLIAFSSLAFALRSPHVDPSSFSATSNSQPRPAVRRLNGVWCNEAMPPADDDEQVLPAADATSQSKDMPPSAAPEKMTMLDNVIFLGYIGGFMAFFFAVASVLKQLAGQQ